MADFEAITTQEQLDGILKDRLARQNDKHTREIAEKYGDYDQLKTKTAEYEKRIAELEDSAKSAAGTKAEYDAKIADAEAKIKNYELRAVKTQVAIEAGLPFDLADRLTGDTADDIRKDAEKLVAAMNKNAKVAPLVGASVNATEDGVTAAFKKINPNMHF